MSTPNQPPWAQQPGQPGPSGQPPHGQPPYGPGQPPQVQPPYGQPPQGQPPYGQSQPGFAPPSYGGQQPPGGYPTPPPPGGYPPGGPGGYPPRPGQPGMPGVPGGQPPTKGSGARIGLIIGAIVLALIIIGVGAAVLLNRSADTASDPPVTGGTGGVPSGGPTGTSAPPTQASSVPPPVSTQADQAVKAYLDALAAGQASVALSLAQEQPADTTFLTDAVLADSLKRAPITDIKVTPPANEYDTSISATYKIGDQQVNEDFTVQKQGDNFLLYRVTQDLNLESLRNRTLPMVINGVEVKTDDIDLFPGSYVFSSGNDNIGYGDGDPLLVKSPNDYPNAYDYRPIITEAGTKAFVRAAKAKLNACAKEAKFKPSGCPFLNVRENPGQNITESSLKRTILEDPFANAEPRLDYQDPAIGEFSITVRWEGTASGTQGGSRARFTIDNATNFTSVRARLTGKDIKVVFGR